MITALFIQNVRNINKISLEKLPRFVFLFGDNGAGKTSILESIYLLAMGRTFRTNRHLPILNHDAKHWSVFAKLEGGEFGEHSLGMQRSYSGEFQARLDGESIKKVSKLSCVLPLRLIDSDAFKIIEGEPDDRRQFIDWGCCQFDQNYLALWQRAKKVLAQRNALLKERGSNAALAYWDSQWIELSNKITLIRESYIQALRPIYRDFLQFSGISLPPLGMIFYQGWEQSRALEEVLTEELPLDRKRMRTQSGFHRADLGLLSAELKANDVLSRGQKKIQAILLLLAQVKLAQRTLSCPPVLLIDDLGAELDSSNRNLVVDLVKAHLTCQVWLSGVDSGLYERAFSGVSSDDLAMFHVKHGELTPFRPVVSEKTTAEADILPS